MSDLFATGIRPAIDEWLLKESRKKRDYGDYWSASQAGYCMRKVILDRLQIPYVTEDPRKQRVFTAGHTFHKWIQEITKESGLSIAQELELQDEGLMVRGHIDDLILIDGHLILYDHKTRNSRSFNFAKQPSHLHKMQLGTYLYMLRKGHDHSAMFVHEDTLRPLINSLTEARTLNIEKDTLRMAEVQYMWSPELEKEVYSYWSTLNGYWEKKALPRCTCESFMAMERYNPFFYQGQPCSGQWIEQFKDERLKGWKL